RVSGSKASDQSARVFYVRRPEMETAEEKRSFLASNLARNLSFDEVQPDKAHNWVNLTNNDFDTLLSLASKETKTAKTAAKERAVFKLYSLGVVTARDEWVYDDSPQTLGTKVTHLINAYNADRRKLAVIRNSNKLAGMLDDSIKWSRAVKKDLINNVEYSFDCGKITASLYRPFVKRCLYFDKQLNEMQYQLDRLFPEYRGSNPYISLVAGSRLNFSALAGNSIPNYAIYSLDPAQCVPLYRFDAEGNRTDNITDWGLKQFQQHYNEITKGADKAKRITKQAIFHYCYAVLYDPLYREKYALNLKREFPRIPFYANFWQWAAWGEALMKLHIGYESVEPFGLQRIDTPDEKARAAGLSPKALLRTDKDAGIITLDTETMLRGIPVDAWNYKLGNRCALEWVLDQYKEKKPKDSTIREKFDTYRFADYKEKVIDLLTRVTTVSAETVRITQAMKQAVR
ncbi:MAG: type ISP restriction/modification enzyme, partial [Nitrosospira sp.]